MRMFKRSAPTRPTDEYLTYFTPAQARNFRHLVSAAFAEVGRDVAVYDDHVEDRTGTSFGLWNIGALCAGVEASEWPELIADHVRRVTTPPRDLVDLSSEEFDAALYLRIVEAAAVPDLELVAYAREVAPGLLEVLSIDLPDSVATPPADDLLARGPLEELLVRGRENLRTLFEADGIKGETVGAQGGGRFTAVTGDSFFTASLALLLPETIERFSRESDFGRGILVAVPFRHQLLYRVIDDPDAALALGRMFHVATRGFYDEAGPLSPHVYWVRNHRWVQVTSMDGGKPRVHLHGKLADAIKVSE